MRLPHGAEKSAYAWRHIGPANAGGRLAQRNRSFRLNTALRQPSRKRRLLMKLPTLRPEIFRSRLRLVATRKAAKNQMAAWKLMSRFHPLRGPTAQRRAPKPNPR